MRIFYKLLIVTHVLFFIAAFYQSCQKDIKLKLKPGNNQLVIECILYPGKVPVLYLSNSVPFFSPMVSPSQLFARGASITITCNSVSDVLLPDSVFDYFRCRWTPFYKGSIPAQTGRSYDLLVNYQGKTYSATTTIDQPKVAINSVSYVSSFHDVYGDHEGVIINFNDPPGIGNYYRFQMDRLIDSSVYGASNLGLVHSTCTAANFQVTDLGRAIYNDKQADGKPMQLVIEPSFLHQQDDSSIVMVQSLSKEAAEFYDNIDKQKLSQFNPFIEPVFLKTKIEGCIGVFGSAVISEPVLFVYPE